MELSAMEKLCFTEASPYPYNNIEVIVDAKLGDWELFIFYHLQLFHAGKRL